MDQEAAAQEENLEAEGTVHEEDLASSSEMPSDTVFGPEAENAVVVTEESESNETKSDEDVAREVLEGKWGKGQEIRVRLADAGYDHNKIRKAVVRLLNS